MHQNIAQHGGDPDRIVVGGHSAGAQLAALVCTDHRYLAEVGVAFKALKGCIPVDKDSSDIPKIIATVTHVARDMGIPPFLILYLSGNPETGAQAMRLEEVLNAADVPVKTYGKGDTNHGRLNDDLGSADDEPTTLEVVKFLDSL